MNLLLAGIVGSTAYGLAGPDSDIDRLGVYAAPTTAFHGLHPPVGKAATVVQKEPGDATYHEAGKLALLCLGGNPTVTELMWLEDYEVKTWLGEELIAIRSAFLSAKRVRDAYFGYATAQFNRLHETGQFQSKQRSRPAKHARHMLRLLDQGYQLYTTGHLTMKLEDPQWYIDQGNLIAADPELAKPMLMKAQERFESATSALPERPDLEAVENWLLQVRAAYYARRD